MSYWYLGSAYSAYPHGKIAAFYDAATQAALLIEAGVLVFCPITHSHPISGQLNEATDTHETWMRIDGPLMAAARGLIVCKLEGWEESRGLAQEIATFKAAGKPIIEMEPGTVPEGLLHDDNQGQRDEDRVRNGSRPRRARGKGAV